MSTKTWKMSFDASLCESEIEGEEGFTTKTSIVTRLLCVTPDSQGGDLPDEMYLSFQRVRGCGNAFNNFVTNVMEQRLSMFVEPKAPEEE